MRNCGVCQHPEKPTIEELGLRREPCAKIAQHINEKMEKVGGEKVSQWQVWRHLQHLGERGALVVEPLPNGDLLARIERLITRLEGVATSASKAKQWGAAATALREVGRCLELLAKIAGLLQPANPSTRVAVAVSVNTVQSTSTMNEFELEQRIALEVSEATNHFDAATLDRLRRLAEGTVPKELSAYATESDELLG